MINGSVMKRENPHEIEQLWPQDNSARRLYHHADILPTIALQPRPGWDIAREPVAYPAALARMEECVQGILTGQGGELVWLLEHPPLYTAGTSADPAELKDAARFPVYEAGRGGRYTYHGPGQRIAYTMLDLRKRGQDLHAHIRRLEEWVIRALRDCGVEGRRCNDRIGVWVDHRGAEKKIAAVGVRVRKWITFHGIAINVAPDLTHFAGIVPCGLHGFGVTSLRDLGKNISMQEFDEILRARWDEVFENR